MTDFDLLQQLQESEFALTYGIENVTIDHALTAGMPK